MLQGYKVYEWVKLNFDHSVSELLEQERPEQGLKSWTLIAQMVEHCPGNTEVRVQISVQAWIFKAFLATYEDDSGTWQFQFLLK